MSQRVRACACAAAVPAGTCVRLGGAVRGERRRLERPDFVHSVYEHAPPAWLYWLTQLHVKVRALAALRMQYAAPSSAPAVTPDAPLGLARTSAATQAEPGA